MLGMPRALVLAGVSAIALLGRPTPASAQCGELVWRQGFDAGVLPVGWSADGLWHVSQACPIMDCLSGPYAYYGIDSQCDYDNGLANEGSLTTPWIALPDLPNGGSIVLDYCEAEITECHDPQWFFLFIEEQNGPSTQKLIRCDDDYAWMGGTPPYPLTDWAGKTIRLRWYFTSGDNWANFFDGIQIDNLEIRAHHLTGPDCNANLVADACDIATGTSKDCNGNGLPDECESVAAAYCTAYSNSTGYPAKLWTTGSTLLSCNDLVLNVGSAPPGKVGIFFFGTQSAGVPFGDGVLCIGGQVERMPLPVVLSPSGAGSLAVDYALYPGLAALVPGDQRYFQFWFRDPTAMGTGWNLSGARRIDFGN